MRLAPKIAFATGTTLLMLGVAASLQDPERDPLGLRLLPAMFLPLPRPLIGGGDFPGALSGAGIVAVYLLPGVLLLGVGFALRRGNPA